MEISTSKYNCLKIMINDLMKAEYFINNLGVETRVNSVGDNFRNIKDILKDIILVCNNNQTILDDCVEFLASNPETKDDSNKFLNKYNLEGIYKNAD